MIQDNWQHRSEGMRCMTCMWYVPKHNASGALVGRCRRHAPTMHGYPVVFATDWCGDHKLDETKLPPPPWDAPAGLGLPPHDPHDCQFCQAESTAVPCAPEDE